MGPDAVISSSIDMISPGLALPFVWAIAGDVAVRQSSTMSNRAMMAGADRMALRLQDIVSQS
jgi:hypothetical protein